MTNRDQACRIEHAIEDLTVFVDSRDWRSLQGDIGPLVATLLGVLSALLSKRQVIKSGVDYLEQELLSAILSLLEKISDAEELNKAHVGIEVIIKVIRGVYILDSCDPAILLTVDIQHHPTREHLSEHY